MDFVTTIGKSKTENAETRNGIAHTYDSMVTLDTSDEALESWENLIADSVAHAKILKSVFGISYVEYEPYGSIDEMFNDFENKVMKVSVLANVHPLWTPEENLDFRIAHDILGHWEMGTCHNIFSFVGEVAAFRSQSNYLTSDKARNALYTEVVGQAAFYGTFREFGEQKIGFLE